MMVEMPLTLLTALLITGVQSLTSEFAYVKPGEMVALHCPYNNAEAQLIWTVHASQEMNLTDSKSALADQNRLGVLIDGRSLIILRASASHEGNYSCSHRNTSSHFWFTLIVYSTQSKENKERGQYPTTCYTKESCMLYCPEVNTPWVNNSNITNHSITWHKKGETLPTQNLFSPVEERDSGIYICTRSYLYDGQIYNMTFTVILDVKPSKKIGQSVIVSPKHKKVFPVNLGSTVVIECKASLYSSDDVIFWLSGSSFVDTDDNLPVFCSESWEENAGKITMTTSLVFKEVSEEDLSKNFTCKLQSAHQLSSFITITMTQKDVKSYDAYLLSYKSAKGLNEDDRRWLEGVLEERFGYSLCLYNHDAIPETAGAEAVICGTEQSRSVVLVPTSSDSGLGADLLKDILTTLVERQIRLVFIIPETVQVSSTNSEPEALKRVRQDGGGVIWKGRNSMEPNSSFLKLLRYRLGAPQHAPRLLRQRKTPDINLYNV